MFILIVFDDVHIEQSLDDAFRRLGRGLSFSSTHVAALRRDPRLDRVPDAVVAEVGGAPSPGLEGFRAELVRRGVPLFLLMTPASLRRAEQGRDRETEVFVLDRDRALRDPVSLANGVVAYVDMRTRSDGSSPVVPGL